MSAGAPAVAPVRPTFSATFRSLRIRNYRLYFIGQLVSLSGTWMQTAAQGWLVYHLTGSGTALGIVTAAQFLPTLVFGVYGGVIADRFEKRRVLLGAQSFMLVITAVLAALSVTGVISYWMVVALAAAFGFGTVIDNPVRQAFVNEMVGREDLPNAVALSSAMFNSARIVGPAIGASVIAAFGDRVSLGAGVCFAMNAASFLAVLIALALMRPSELQFVPKAPRARGQIREGFHYAMSEPRIRVILVLMTLVGLLGMNFQVLLPIAADKAFNGGAGAYGLLSVAMGVGSLIGSMAAAMRRDAPTLRVIGIASFGFGLFVSGVALAPSLHIGMALLVLAGISSMTLFASCNTTLQLVSRPELRGRVMSLYILVLMGTTPIGGPVIGAIAQHAGVRVALAIAGATGLVGALWVASGLRRTRVAAQRAVAEHDARNDTDALVSS